MTNTLTACFIAATLHYFIVSSFWPFSFISSQVEYEKVMFPPSSMQSEQQNSDFQDEPDFSWTSAKSFWIVMIVASVVVLLHILYKAGKRHRYKRQIRTAPSFSLRSGRLIRISQDRRQDCAVQRPLRVMTRRCSGGSNSSSKVSILPRYEQFAEGEACGQHVQIEKRGRYTYVLGQQWPGQRE